MDPKVVVITGSTRGIGLGLAREFLAHGCEVVISGRSQITVDEIVEKLLSEFKSAHIVGHRSSPEN